MLINGREYKPVDSSQDPLPLPSDERAGLDLVDARLTINFELRLRQGSRGRFVKGPRLGASYITDPLWRHAVGRSNHLTFLINGHKCPPTSPQQRRGPVELTAVMQRESRDSSGGRQSCRESRGTVLVRSARSHQNSCSTLPACLSAWLEANGGSGEIGPISPEHPFAAKGTCGLAKRVEREFW